MNIIKDAKDRIVSRLTENITGAIAFPYWQRISTQFPYFVMRLATTTYSNNSESIRVAERSFIILGVVGHSTEGYDGDTEFAADELVMQVENVFDSKPGRRLVSTQYPTSPTWLYPQGVFLTTNTGLRGFRQDGIDTVQIGVEFTLTIPYFKNVF